MNEPEKKKSYLVESLEKLVEDRDRAALASLRRGLGKPPEETHDLDWFVLPRLPKDANRWDESRYKLVASLFAYWHQGDTPLDRNPPENFGTSLALLRNQAPNPESVERRFVALLNCHRDDLPDHLRHAVGLLRSKGVAVDWSQLLHDISGWNWESRSVQRNWAHGFWQRPEREDETADAKTEAEAAQT